MELRIGCTGWSYEGWVGPFYPKKMDNINHLKHYSSVFDLTEVNSTFYRIPTTSMTQKWYLDTPENFLFTAKLPKLITHDNRLKPGPYLDQFLQSLKPLGKKMSVLVIQLPPSLSFSKSEQNLDKMIRYLPKDYKYVVEGRHESWFSDQAYRFLSERNISLVWNEVHGVENPAPLTTDFVYIRLIGDRSISEEDFGKVQKDRTDLVKKWAQRVKAITNQISYAIVVANNHFEGFAPATVNSFRVEMGLEQLTWIDTKQKTLFDLK